MENWGLITYRETSLLYSEEETSVESKQWIGVVVAHELAHQWFGNLVTMLWWNDLWLNEGFASWMEYRGVDHIQPDWKMRDQFLVDVVAPALELDSLTTSHPISVEVKDPKVLNTLSKARTSCGIKKYSGYQFFLYQRELQIAHLAISFPSYCTRNNVSELQ